MAKTDEFDTRAWLTDLGFGTDEVTSLLPQFEGRKDKVAAHQLRQSDYDRRMNAGKATLEAKQAELDAKDQQLNQEMAEWAVLKQTDTKAAAEAQKTIAAIKQEKFQLEQAIDTLAQQAGIDPATVLPQRGSTTPPPPAPSSSAPALPAGFDPSKVLTIDQLGPIVSLLLNQSPDIYAITQEHQRLTGKPLPPEDLQAMVTEMPTRAARKQPADLRAIWEAKFNVPELRRTQAEAQRQADLKAEYDRGQMDARTNAALPTAHAPGLTSPVFHHPESAPGAPKAPGLSDARAAQATRLGRTQRAITALTTGKYRSQATPGGGGQ